MNRNNRLKELEKKYMSEKKKKIIDHAEEALKYYKEKLTKDSSNLNSTFYDAYCKALNCQIEGIASVITNVDKCLESVIIQINENNDEKEQELIIDELISSTIDICSALYMIAKMHYAEIAVKPIYETRNINFVDEWLANVSACTQTLYNLGNLLEQELSDNMKEKAVEPWIIAIEIHNDARKHIIDKNKINKIINIYSKKIKNFESDYQMPKEVEKELLMHRATVVLFLMALAFGLLAMML